MSKADERLIQEIKVSIERERERGLDRGVSIDRSIDCGVCVCRVPSRRVVDDYVSKDTREIASWLLTRMRRLDRSERGLPAAGKRPDHLKIAENVGTHFFSINFDSLK
jgi:hypothetical protein